MTQGKPSITSRSGLRSEPVGFRETDAVDGLFEVFRSFVDLDFEAEIPGFYGRDEVEIEPGRILLGGDHVGGSGCRCFAVELIELVCRETMVIDEVLLVEDAGTKLTEEALEAFGNSDSAEAGDGQVTQELQIKREVFLSHFAEAGGTVGAFDDIHIRIVAEDSLAQFGVGAPIRLGDEDVGRSPDVVDGFAQNASREELAVAERIGLVDEDKVEPAFERAILETVIQNERIHSEFLDRVGSCLDAVFIHHDDDTRQVFGEHVGFIARQRGIEQHPLAIADHLGVWIFSMRDPAQSLFPCGFLLALVPAAEDPDGAAAIPERPGNPFDNRGFAGAPNREVSDHDHKASKGLTAEDPMVV